MDYLRLGEIYHPREFCPPIIKASFLGSTQAIPFYGGAQAPARSFIRLNYTSPKAYVKSLAKELIELHLIIALETLCKPARPQDVVLIAPG